MTHGTLTNNETGQALMGTDRPSGNKGFFHFCIDGCRSANNFRRDEWTFTPDPEPLPTEDGWYVSDAPDFEGHVYQRYRGVWYSRIGTAFMEDMMRERLPLVRLVREDGK